MDDPISEECIIEKKEIRNYCLNQCGKVNCQIRDLIKIQEIYMFGGGDK